MTLLPCSAAMPALTRRPSTWKHAPMFAFKLIPFVVVFAFGCYAGVVISRKYLALRDPQNWESKYRSVEQRYRDLTRQLKDVDSHAGERANRLRQTLWDIQGILRNSKQVSPQKIESVLAEIDTALREGDEPI